MFTSHSWHIIVMYLDVKGKICGLMIFNDYIYIQFFYYSGLIIAQIEGEIVRLLINISIKLCCLWLEIL